jgi:hypothetical protein
MTAATVVAALGIALGAYYLCGFIWWGRSGYPSPRPPRWLRPVLDDKGSPRMQFLFAQLAVTVIMAILAVGQLAEVNGRARQTEHDRAARIEHLLIEIRDELRSR